MRASLDKIERVDQYLTGQLNAAEKLDFMKGLETDLELSQLLNIQKDMITAIQRKALKAEIKKTVSHTNIWKWLWKSITGGIALLIVICIVFFIITLTRRNTDQKIQTDIAFHQLKEKLVTGVVHPYKSSSSGTAKTLTSTGAANPIFDHEFLFDGLATWAYPNVQEFQIDPSKGATFEGEEGTFIAVPTHAFLDENNVTVQQPVDCKLVEALKLEDMVLYNLTTTTDGKLLQTEGMLHFEFTSGGKKVHVNPDRPLYIEVPTNEVKKNMMLFEGETVSEKVNWKNPKPLKKYLKHVDFSQLDFFPWDFKNTVIALLPKLRYKHVTDRMIDSMYYSLRNCGRRNYKPTSAIPGSMKDSVVNICCGIDPLLIQSIRTPDYENTFVSTTEFSQRVKVLHREENGNELLKIYLRNLEKDMVFSDSIIARHLTAESQKKIYEKFVKQGLTNVMNLELYDNQLKTYRQKKLEQYKTAQEHVRKELRRMNAEGVKHPGYDTKVELAKQLPTPRPVYQFQWARNGWLNIDKYYRMVSDDPEFVTMYINGAKGTTIVYQWLNSISALTPLTLQGNIASALFPNKNSEFARSMENTFCFAISRKDGTYRWCDARFNPYETDSMELRMKPMSMNEIKMRLRAYNVSERLDDRLNAVEKEINDADLIRTTFLKYQQIRGSQKERLNDVKEVFQQVAFPCILTEKGNRISKGYYKNVQTRNKGSRTKPF